MLHAQSVYGISHAKILSGKRLAAQANGIAYIHAEAIWQAVAIGAVGMAVAICTAISVAVAMTIMADNCQRNKLPKTVSHVAPHQN